MVSNKTIPTGERTRVQKSSKSPRRREPARWMPGAASPLLLEASDATVPALLRLLDAHESGLPASEVEPRLAKFGRNEVATENPPAWYRMLLRNLRNPFVVVLMLLGAVSLTTGDLRAGVVVGVMVVVSVLMRFVSEYRSTLAAEALRTMVRTTATVIRQVVRAEPDGTMRLHPEKAEVPFETLVPGDLIHLSAGDMVPADLRLITAKDLFVSQSALTGESMPVEKTDTVTAAVEGSAAADRGRARDALGRTNLCFMGTSVVSGSGLGLAVATGRRAYFGSMASSLLGRRSLTSFDRGVNAVSWVLIRFMAVMVPVVFLVNGMLKGDWVEAFLFGIAVAVGLTPEMLPMIVTANLAKGAWMMARHKCVVKRLSAIQNLGAMDVCCTDKTGTLTEDKIVLERYLDPHGRDSDRVLELAYLNSYWQTGLKNLLDRAVLEHVQLNTQLDLPQGYRKVDEIPFDFDRRRMSVVVARADAAEHTLICKGAVEELLKVSSHVEDGGRLVPLDAERRRRAETLARRLNMEGLRVIAVGSRVFGAQRTSYGVPDESDLVLAGFIAFLDPPKQTAAPAIRALREHGVAVKIITGDNDIVTRRVCRLVGLEIERLLLGPEVEMLDDDDLAAAAERVTVFAKVAPMQKARIIRALQRTGHTVGYLGDGINDAAALRDADVGISVDTAADIARESADIIMLEKSLLVLADGIAKGREVYGNIIKYIKMTASSNFGNVFSVLVASALLPFLPMLPIHLLIQNLLYDFSQLTIPWDRMDAEFLAQPRRWDPSGIARFMLCMGPVSSVFDVLTFAVLWFVFHASSPAQQSLFQSGWFVEGLLTQTLVVHVIRTRKVPFVGSRASLPVMVTTAAVMALGVCVPFTPFGHAVGLVSLPWAYFPWLGALLLGYCLLAQAVKRCYTARFDTWL
jgi:Mg2+-importing ATPase